MTRRAPTHARSRLARLFMIALGCALAVLGASAAQAEAPPPKILVIGRASGDPAVPRLCAELAALGFEILEMEDQDAAPGRAELEEITRSAGAIAAVRLVAKSGGIEVWIVDRVTGESVLRAIVEPEGASSDPAATVAVQTVELLRASLLEIHDPHPSRGEAAAPPEVEITAELPEDISTARDDARFGGELAAGALLSPGGVDPMPALLLTAFWMPAPRVGVHGLLAFSVVSSTLEGPEGSAAISAGLAGGGVRLLLRSPDAAWVPTFELGVAGSWLEARGSAREPYFGTSSSRAFVAPYVRCGVGVSMTESVRARVSILGAFAAPEPVVRFAGREAASFGRPLLAPSFGIEGAWH